MKRLLVFIFLCANISLCFAVEGSSKVETKLASSTLTIKVDSTCVPLDSTHTIQIDTATLSAFEENLLSKRQFAVEIDSLKNAMNNTEKKHGNFGDILLLVWGIVLTIGLFLLVLFHFRKRHDDIIATVKNNASIRSWILSFSNSNDRLTLPNNHLQSYETNALQKRIEELENRIRVLENTKDNSETKKGAINSHSSNERTTPDISNPRKFYAESIHDSRYVKVKETHTDDAIFELTTKSDKTTATVTICKTAFRKVLANPSYLDGCDKQVFGNTTVNIEEEGTAEKTDDNRWVVRKQIKVVLR